MKIDNKASLRKLAKKERKGFLILLLTTVCIWCVAQNQNRIKLIITSLNRFIFQRGQKLKIMTKNEKKDLEALKIGFKNTEWEDFLLVLNDIRKRDKELIALYRKSFKKLKEVKKLLAE